MRIKRAMALNPFVLALGLGFTRSFCKGPKHESDTDPELGNLSGARGARPLSAVQVREISEPHIESAGR